jgi:hypothetical protein
MIDSTLGSVPTIRFLPDGSIAETSPEQILLVQAQKDAIVIGISTNRLRYEIHPGNAYANRR